jgi:signal transduction histidine kinase
MQPRRASLWVEIVLALSLITLVTIVLNAGVFWLILKRAEEARRTDLAETLVDGLVAQLGVAARESGAFGGPRPAEILEAYASSSISFDALYIVAADATPLQSVVGTPPDVLDSGLREALYGRNRTTRIDGSVWGDRAVEVTAPVLVRGGADAAIRVRLPLASPSVFGSPSAFTLAYTTSTGVLIALFGFSLFRRRLIRPIAEVREGTQRIARGEFGHQVEVDAALEFQALCAALNSMSTDLSQFRHRTDEQIELLSRANEELQVAQTALVRSERLAGVGRLAAGLAHEVGNPLSAVLGYFEFIEDTPHDTDLHADLLQRSKVELERIHRIIRALLDYSRQGSGEVELVGVEEAVQDAISLTRHVPRLRAVEVRWERGDLSHLRVRMEQDKLHQVLVNILLNAGDAVRTAEHPVVRVEVDELDDHVRIRCTDCGPGFSKDALERGVEPFFTTKEPGHGTGLGLAISASVVEAAGGTLVLGNQPSGGAVVDILLPMADSP